jgi:MFS family permease
MSLQTPILEDASTHNLPAKVGYRAVLSNKSFLALWIGQVFSQLADRIIFVVFIILVVQHYGGQSEYKSFLYVAFTIPAVLLTAVAGVFVDRWPRRAVLITTNLIRAALVALIPWAAKASGGWAIYLVAFLISSVTQFFVPAEAATIPMVVDKKSLLTANSLFTTTMMASVIFGFALGDPLISIFSLAKVHWVISGLFILASISLALVKPKANAEVCERTRSGSVQESCSRFFSEIKEGVAYINENTMVRNAMLKLAIIFSAIVALCLLFITFAQTYLFSDPAIAAQKFAYIIAFSGVGMALGGFLVGQVFHHTRRGLMVYSGFVGVGICLVILPLLIILIPQHDSAIPLPHMISREMDVNEFRFTFRMLFTYTMSILMGVGAAFIAIPLQAVLQEMIPEDKRGKVFGVQFTILSTASTLPALIAGYAVDHVGVGTIFLLLGSFMLVFGAAGLFQRIQAGRNRDVFTAHW